MWTGFCDSYAFVHQPSGVKTGCPVLILLEYYTGFHQFFTAVFHGISLKPQKVLRHQVALEIIDRNSSKQCSAPVDNSYLSQTMNKLMTIICKL